MKTELKRVVYVRRPKLSVWDKLGISAFIYGLSVTVRHFFSRKVTVQYPEERSPVPLGYRGVPALVRDQHGNIKCVACQLCEFVCPSKAITVSPPGPDGPVPDRPLAEKMPIEFRVNVLRCIFCGLCQEVCPEEAIFLQSHHIFVVERKDDMIFRRDRLLEIGGKHHGYLKWHKLEQERQPNPDHSV